MEQVYPLHEEVVSRYCGLPVCVVMNDGTRHVGILSSCQNGQVCLNGDASSKSGPEATLMKAQPSVSKKKKGGKGNKATEHLSGKIQAQTQQAYPYDPDGYDYGYQNNYNPWGGTLLLDFALIAFLFLLL